MSLKLRFVLDTNILIPLQDSFALLETSLANFVRLAGAGGHQLLYHPASEQDIQRDKNHDRRARTLARLAQYTRLEGVPSCPWNTSSTSPNDACDNEILFSLECEAAHALVTEDKGLHAKAQARGLGDRVYFIQTAEDWLKRLHEPSDVYLPKIRNVPLHGLVPTLQAPFFNSLREGYDGFDDWLKEKARGGRKAWAYYDANEDLAAVCIYAIQENELISDDGTRLPGRSLKLCTFKVGELVRGRKIGELFLKAAFKFATENRCGNIFIHANEGKHHHLLDLLLDFGFQKSGTYQGDGVYVKQHPAIAPPFNSNPLDYLRRYFPHYQDGSNIGKFIVPIKPKYHKILFPEYEVSRSMQMSLFGPSDDIGNAIKLAYLSLSPTKSLKEGDVVLFYRSDDEKAITTLGVVERFEISSAADEIARLVSRRTVYRHDEIAVMAESPTRVILFRLIGHLSLKVQYSSMISNGWVKGPIQSITKIDDATYFGILRAAGR